MTLDDTNARVAILYPGMIKSFADKATAAVFSGLQVRKTRSAISLKMRAQ
jgi:hypothetical protein